MRNLAQFGQATDAAVSAAVAGVLRLRGSAAGPACTSVAAPSSCSALDAAAFSSTATCRRLLNEPRLAHRCDPYVYGRCEPFFSPYTCGLTKCAIYVGGTGGMCPSLDNAHNGGAGKYACQLHRNRTNVCVHRTVNGAFSDNVCREKLRWKTCRRGPATRVEQLLTRKHFQREHLFSFNPVANHHVFIPTSANAHVSFRTVYSASVQSEIHAYPSQNTRTWTVERKRWSSDSHAVPAGADTGPSASTTSRNLSSDGIIPCSKYTSGVCHEGTLTEGMDGGLTHNVENSRERDSNRGGVCSKDWRNKTTALSTPPPGETQENERAHRDQKWSSSAQPLRARASENFETVSSQSIEAANATSRRQWDVHAAALRKALQRAEFVSVDMELTGLHIRNEKFIGVDRCYEAHCEGARAFMPIQLGLCAARRAGPEHPHRWILTPASIYIFPVDTRIFQASTATMSFLRESGLDFNEWIEHGVPYMRAQEEREKRQALEARILELEQLRLRATEERNSGACLAEREVQPQVFPYELATVEDKQLADTVRAAIYTWLASGNKQPLHLPVDNPLQRLLLHSLVASEFPNLSSHSAKAGDQRILAIYQSEGEVYEEQLRALKEDVARLEHLRGVRQLLDDIAERRLVVVGHNCFYDLLHLYQTLYGDLPESVAAFKSSWTQTFPYTFDTKLIAETHEVLASLHPPATLKELCTFMATINAASRERDPRSAQQIGDQIRRDYSCSQGPLALEIQLERLPGTRWSLPTPVQSLSTTAHVMSGDAAELLALVPNGGSGCLDGKSLTQAAELHVQTRNQSASLTQNKEGDTFAETNGGANTAVTEEEDYSHDAGYDSLMTSVVYLLQLAHVLPYHGLRWENVNFGSNFVEDGRDEASSNSTANPREFKMRTTQNEINTKATCSVTEFFSFFLNKIRLSRTQPASVNLGGKDDQLFHQKRLLFMRNHPASWKKWEIMKIWSPVWVDVQMVDESSSWIVARDEEDAQNIWTIYQMMKNPQFE